MSKYEYKSFQIYPPWWDESGGSDNYLNKLGAEGWRLIHVQPIIHDGPVQQSNKAWGIMIREITGEEEG